MKLNYKIYRQLTNDPFLTQEIEGKVVEFHYMNDTPYLIQYAGRGRFALWTSDGINYKVLIEKTYYEAMKEFYAFEVNTIWLNFLEKVGKINQRINKMFIIPTLLLYVIIAILATFLFQDYTMQILLGMIIIVVISNMLQGRVVNKNVREENIKAQNNIREYIGAEKFDELIKSQDEHYQQYFKFENQNENEENNSEENNQIEEEKDNDGTKSN